MTENYTTEERWRELRAGHIGGSEVAALFGESPYLSYYKLWCIKNNLLLEDDLDDVEIVEAGNFMEPAAINWYNKRYDTAFYQPKIYIKHATIKGMGCTPDALDALDSNRMAQVKNVGVKQFSEKWEAEGREIKKAPFHILLQCQHEIECANIDESHLIVLVGGNRLYRLIIKRDREIGKIICDAVEKFWNTKEQPKPDFERDGDSINKIRESRLSKLLSLVEEDFSDDKYFSKLARKALTTASKKKIIEDKLNSLTAELTVLMGDAEVVKSKDLIIKLPRGRKTPTYISTKEIY